MKRIAALLLAGVMTLGIAAYADETIEEMPITISRAEENEYPVTIGTVEAVEADASAVTVKTESGVYDELVANMDISTAVLSASGEYLADGIKVGDKVAVYHSDAVTMSLPAQSYAYAVIVLDDSDKMPAYIRINDVQKNGDDYVIASTGGEYEFSAVKETAVVPYLTKNIVKAQDLKVGDGVLVWYDVITMSLPAKATAEKIMLVNPAVETEELEGTAMITLRDVAEKLGAEVSWDAETNTASVTLDGRVCSFTIGSKDIVADGEKVEAEFAPVLHNDRTMVSADLFENLFAVTLAR